MQSDIGDLGWALDGNWYVYETRQLKETTGGEFRVYRASVRLL